MTPEQLRQRLEELIKEHQMTFDEAMAKAKEQEPGWSQEDHEHMADNICYYDYIEAFIKAVPELIVENNRVLLEHLKVA